MNFFIEIRRVADSWGLISKDGKGIGFKTDKDARKYGRKNIKSRYIAEWKVITRGQAKEHYEI